MHERRSVIAAEGLPYIGVLGLLAWVTALIGLTVISLILGVLALVVMYFFRDPERLSPGEPGCVVAAADGTITGIDNAIEPFFLNREMVRVGTFLSILDCHVNRFPFKGKIVSTKYVEGKFLNARLKRSSMENERLATLVEMEDGREAVIVQVAGLVARRIVFYKDLEDVVDRGERFGMIKFGSRVDLYLPLDFKPAVSPGDKVKAAESIIGWLHE